MKDQTEYPKQMVHPAYVKGTTTAVHGEDSVSGRKFIDYQGTPDRYPPVAVSNPDEEAQYRAKGYKAYGEPDMNAIGFIEYPKMMVHPQHEPAVEAIVETRNGAGQLLSAAIPGRAAKFPPMTVNNPREEESATARGYETPGKSDPEAMAASKASPYQPGRVTNEYPKMVDGKLVQDPAIDLNAAKEYPKWIAAHGKQVNNRAEEEALLGPLAAPSKEDVARAKREAALKAKADAEAALAAAEAELAGDEPVITRRPVVVESEVVPPAAHDAAAPTLTDRAEIMADLERRGIPFNKYWKIDKLQAALRRGEAA